MSNSVPINDKRKNAGNGATVQTTTLPPHPDPNAPPSWATGAPKAAAQPPPAAATATQPTTLDAAAVASTPFESVRPLIDQSAVWPAQGPRQLQVIWMLTHGYQAADILTNLRDVSPAYLEACRRLLTAAAQPTQPPADQPPAPAPVASTPPTSAAPALPNFDMPMRSVLEHQIRAGRTDDQILTDYAARMPAITRDSLVALRYHMAVPTAQVALPAAFDTPVSQLDAPRVDSSFLGEAPTLAQQQPVVAVHLESHAGATAHDVVKASQGENPWSKIPERAGAAAPAPAAEASNPKKGPRWSEARRERTKELVQLGKGAEEIAADISMPVEKVTEYLEELGQVAAVSSGLGDQLASAIAADTHAQQTLRAPGEAKVLETLTDAELDAFGRFVHAASSRLYDRTPDGRPFPLAHVMNEEIVEMRLRIRAWEKLAAFFPRAR